MDGEGLSFDGGLIWDTCIRTRLVRVGHSPPRSTRVRGVVRPGEVAAHQSSREDVIGHHVTAMCDNSTVVVYVGQPPSEMDREARHPSR